MSIRIVWRPANGGLISFRVGGGLHTGDLISNRGGDVMHMKALIRVGECVHTGVLISNRVDGRVHTGDLISVWVGGGLHTRDLISIKLGNVVHTRGSDQY